MKKSLIAIGIVFLVIGSSALGSITNKDIEIYENAESHIDVNKLELEIPFPDSDELPKSN